MNKPPVDLSIIIVNYNTEALTKTCLLSLTKAKQIDDMWEVILVDNGSTDGSTEALQHFINITNDVNKITKFIPSKKNVGFSAGNNIGIKASVGSSVLLLNSDTEVSLGSIQQVYQRLHSDSSIGAATCKLVLPNGSIDPACHRGFPTPWASATYFFALEKLFPHSRLFSQYHMGFKNIDHEHEIDAISGAFFMVKRTTIDTVGLLDESYFMYGEDLDWAYRIRQKGYKILFIPDVYVLHKKKQSGRDNIDPHIKKQTTISFYQTMQLFYRKHYQNIYPFFFTWFILTLLDLRIWITKKGLL
jgi:GT2 family glycosyltransferase